MSVINIVGTICPPETEGSFNKWYSEKHIPDLMKFKGLKKASLYRMSGASTGSRETPLTIIGGKEGYPKFLAIYEFEDLETFERFEKSPEALAARKDAVKVMEETGFKAFWRVQYELIGTKKQLKDGSLSTHLSQQRDDECLVQHSQL